MDTRLAHALTGRYQIERKLGAGGMATVWLAHDLKHDREVAIKVLHPQLAAVLGAERFLYEIRTTAQLQHLHILPLFDSGEADGLLYYVMPYVEGESLRDRLIRETRISVSDTVRIAAEVASALEYAHSHGVIHRDIKPENILLQGGRALVADFGIALASTGDAEQRITETGISLGTPAYMSPEQALGERVLDARSDVYALGALIHEMLTGNPPFKGESAQAIVAKVITQSPSPPSRERKEVSAHLDGVVLKALQKKPADRFSSAAELQVALENGAGAHPRRKSAPLRRLVVPLTVILLAAGAIYVLLVRGTSVTVVNPSIAALPFKYQDSADAYLGDQIPAEILDALTHVPALTVRPLASAHRFQNNHDLRAVARELEVSTLLTGSVAREGDRIRVTARLYDATRNQDLPTVSFTNNAVNTFALQDSLSATIVSSFNLRQSSAQTDAQLATARAGRTRIPAAHDSLMLARFYAEQRSPTALTKAVTIYRSAIRLDSTYAEAWAGLANALSLLANFGDSLPSLYYLQAKANVEHALTLDSTSALSHTVFGFIKVSNDRDYPGARVEFSKALALDSTQSTPWLFQSWYFLGIGRLDSARWSMRHGLRVDPTASIVGTRLGLLLYFSDSLGDAERQLESVLKSDPDQINAKWDLETVYADHHRCANALEIAAELSRQPFMRQYKFQPYVLARCGRVDEARRMVDTAEARAMRGEHINGFSLATAYAALNDRASMYRWLNKALDDRSCCMFQLRFHPAFRQFRAEPEFIALVRRAVTP